MKRVITVVVVVMLLVTVAAAQRPVREDKINDDGPRAVAAIHAPALNASLPSKPMHLIGSVATDDAVEITPTDINADEIHAVSTNAKLYVPADPSRTYLYLCASSSGFWQQAPSASPLLFRGLMLVRFETSVGPLNTFSQPFEIPSGTREFDVSTRTINHTAFVNGCATIDETQLALFYRADPFFLSEADALTTARQVIRSSTQLTVRFRVRMRSVSDFESDTPALQVWSD